MTNALPFGLVARGHGRLKCDTPGCGHVEELSQPLDDTMIGRLCPRCDANLLSAEDYALAKTATALLDAMPRPTPEMTVKVSEITIKVKNGDVTAT